MQHNPSTIQCSIIRDHSITRREVIMQLIEEQDELEEVSDVVED
jgi:hypothetical protein